MSALHAAAVKSTHPRLGFLGVGWIGGNRLKALAENHSAEIIAIADSVDENAAAATRAIAATSPGAQVVDSLDALLDTALDGLVIATPSSLHPQQANAALQRGLAVFCQKPLARTAHATRRVVETARATDRLLAVDFCYRTIRGASRLRELIQCDALGEIYAVELTFHNAYGPDKPWFYDLQQSGGGCVMDLGIHLVDLALWMLDYPAIDHVTSRLYAQGRRLELLTETLEDHATADIELETGANLRLACSWNLPAGQDCVIEAAFYGTRSGAVLRNINGSFYDFYVEHLRGTARQVLGSDLSNRGDDWGGRALIEWSRRLAIDGGYDPSAEHLIKVAEVMDAIYQR